MLSAYFENFKVETIYDANQNWINSDLNYLANIVEIESNSHNPLLTNMENYEEISKFIKNTLKKIK